MKRLVSILVVLAAACSSGSRSGGPVIARQTIGPAGGTIESADRRLQLDFPAGALPADTEITIRRIDPSELGPEFAGVSVEAAYDLGPDGLQFPAPVTVTFESSQTPVQGPGLLSAGVRVLLTSSGGQVERLGEPHLTLDAGANRVVQAAQLDHFSPLVGAVAALSIAVAIGEVDGNHVDVGFSTTGFPELTEEHQGQLWEWFERNVEAVAQRTSAGSPEEHATVLYEVTVAAGRIDVTFDLAFDAPEGPGTLTLEWDVAPPAPDVPLDPDAIDLLYFGITVRNVPLTFPPAAPPGDGVLVHRTVAGPKSLARMPDGMLRAIEAAQGLNPYLAAVAIASETAEEGYEVVGLRDEAGELIAELLATPTQDLEPPNGFAHWAVAFQDEQRFMEAPVPVLAGGGPDGLVFRKNFYDPVIQGNNFVNRSASDIRAVGDDHSDLIVTFWSSGFVDFYRSPLGEPLFNPITSAQLANAGGAGFLPVSAAGDFDVMTIATRGDDPTDRGDAYLVVDLANPTIAHIGQAGMGTRHVDHYYDPDTNTLSGLAANYTGGSVTAFHADLTTVTGSIVEERAVGNGMLRAHQTFESDGKSLYVGPVVDDRQIVYVWQDTGTGGILGTSLFDAPAEATDVTDVLVLEVQEIRNGEAVETFEISVGDDGAGGVAWITRKREVAAPAR